jgi:hypothetical protein
VTFVRCAALLGAIALVAAAPASAAMKTETATAGQVTATLTYTSYGKPDFPSYRGVRVKIVRAGGTLRDDAAPKSFPECRTACDPAPLNAGSADNAPSIFVRDVNADGEPEVWADFYTGGANCCIFSAFYNFDAATGTYVRQRRDWLYSGYSLRDLDGDGTLEFEGADGRFRYAFACGACSPLPPQVFNFVGGRFLDVTRRFPAVLRTDAATEWRYFLRNRRRYDMRGFMAAYVADEYQLGQGRAGWRRAVAAERAGYFNKSSKRGLTSPPYGVRYLRDLRRFLVKNGYIP